MKRTKNTVARRSFIKGAVAATGVAAGCSTLGAAAALADEQAWDEEFDIVVVGAGAAGSVAALTVATEGNGESCLLLEKGEVPSGCTPYAGGRSLWTNDAEAMKKYLKGMSEGVTPDDILDVFAEGMTGILDWLYSIGASEGDLTLVQPGTEDAFPTREPEHPEVEGSYSIGVLSFGGDGATNEDAPTHINFFLQDKIAEHSDAIDYRTSTPVDDLIVDAQSGRVVGVLVGESRIKANKAVILCCGGFEHNEKMLENYLGVGAAISSAGAGNTGDGIRMCQKVGADMWHMSSGAIFWLGGRSLDNEMAVDGDKQYGITVGVNGRRFYMDWDGCKVNIEKDGYEYLSDERVHVGYRHGMTQFGGYWRHLPMPDTAWFVFDAAGMAAGAFPTDSWEDPVGDGILLTADTLEDLAAQMDVPSEELVATVAQWNEICEKGSDTAFYRPAHTLNPVSEPPYYAQLCVPSMLNTDGGPVRDAACHVLDPDGEAIPGLLAAGELGSVWGHKYQGCGNIAECLVFGRIAAQTAMSEA